MSYPINTIGIWNNDMMIGRRTWWKAYSGLIEPGYGTIYTMIGDKLNWNTPTSCNWDV